MRNYLNTKINPVFEKLIVDLLIDMPDNFVYFIFIFIQKDRFCDWLVENQGQKNIIRIKCRKQLQKGRKKCKFIEKIEHFYNFYN